jgi:Zn-dependent peptidase ImmA (M78 family)
MAGIISDLRDVVPMRALTVPEALRTAELQANRLIEECQLLAPPVAEEIIARLPRLQIERLSPSPVSGAAQWSRGRWLIVLNGAEPYVRQRFSLAHEFKHVLDNPFISLLYPDLPGMTGSERAEQICDYFAACLLMPRAWVKRLYCDDRIQDVGRLARRFDVSKMAMQVRLLQIGLVEPPSRCGHRDRRPVAA